MAESSALFARKLHALGYPNYAHGVDVSSLSSVQSAIVFLESAYIKGCTEDDQKNALESAKVDQQWVTSTLRPYFESVGCPLDTGCVALPFLLEWLINRAVHARFSAQSSALNEWVKEALSCASVSCFPDFESDAFADATRELAARMGLPPGVASPKEILLGCVRCALRHRLRASERHSAQRFQLDDDAAFPLGFRTGCAPLDNGAKVVRLLYAEELTQLQSKINALVVAVQNYTANPQVNSKLGRVGR